MVNDIRSRDKRGYECSEPDCTDIIKNKTSSYCRFHAAAATRRSKYGLTREELHELVEIKNCELCGIDLENTRAHIDHNHSTGKVRGMLCTKCNTGLGKFNDDIEMLSKAIKYLSSCP